MKFDPREAAAGLVREHGLEQARAEVMSAIVQAQEDGDNYTLSLWREVKRVLERWPDSNGTD